MPSCACVLIFPHCQQHLLCAFAFQELSGPRWVVTNLSATGVGINFKQHEDAGTVSCRHNKKPATVDRTLSPCLPPISAVISAQEVPLPAKFRACGALQHRAHPHGADPENPRSILWLTCKLGAKFATVVTWGSQSGCLTLARTQGSSSLLPM